MNSRLLQQLVRFANPPKAENNEMMEFVVCASERIMGLTECRIQAAEKSFLQREYQRAMQGLVFISIFQPNAANQPRSFLRRLISLVVRQKGMSSSAKVSSRWSELSGSFSNAVKNLIEVATCIT